MSRAGFVFRRPKGRLIVPRHPGELTLDDMREIERRTHSNPAVGPDFRLLATLAGITARVSSTQLSGNMTWLDPLPKIRRRQA